MPFVQVDDVQLYYRTDGDPVRPCVLLSNSLGTDMSMWDSQAAKLAREFFVVRCDTRGHGRSGRGSAPVTLERLGRDVLGLLDALSIPHTHFCGISMGGMTGQWLAIHQPQRVGKLVLANTAARIGNAEGWQARAAQVRRDGMDGVADGAAARWFTPEFIEREPHTVAGMIGRLRSQDREGYAACCDALAQADLRSSIKSIRAPTLVIAGKHDPVTTVADGNAMCVPIPDARIVVLPAAHLSNVEAGEQFTHTLEQFLVGAES